MKPKSYKQMKGCNNCKHSQIAYKWGYGPRLYCNYGRSKIRDLESFRKYETWEKWFEGREVREIGSCDELDERGKK